MCQNVTCVHAPIAGVKLAAKNPIATLATIAFVGIVYYNYGIWPFLAVVGMIGAIVGAIVWLTLKHGSGVGGGGSVHIGRSSFTENRRYSSKPQMCIANDGKTATRILAVSNGLETKEIAVCPDHERETRLWAVRNGYRHQISR